MSQAFDERDETILLIEDEPNVRDLVREALELGGYAVLEARHADDALAVAERHAGPIHLVISDVLMPGLSPHDFLQQIARRRPDVRILYLSGHTEEEIEQRSGPLPGPLLKKPFPLRVLAEKVREILDAPDERP